MASLVPKVNKEKPARKVTLVPPVLRAPLELLGLRWVPSLKNGQGAPQGVAHPGRRNHCSRTHSAPSTHCSLDRCTTLVSEVSLARSV